MNEFIGKDLSIILPPLVSDVHVERLNPKRINGTLFFRKHLTPQLCLHRKGHLLFTKLGVRLGSSIEKGLTYLGILNFDLNESTKMIITVDDTSMITGMTKSARRYFKKGDYLADYQVKMEKIFDVRDPKRAPSFPLKIPKQENCLKKLIFRFFNYL